MASRSKFIRIKYTTEASLGKWCIERQLRTYYSKPTESRRELTRTAGICRQTKSVNTRSGLSLHKMSSLRLISSAARRATSFSLARRGYADISDKLHLSLTLPHKVPIFVFWLLHKNVLNHYSRPSSTLRRSFK